MKILFRVFRVFRGLFSREGNRELITLTLDKPDHPGCALHNAPPSPPVYRLPST
jgi:hypothetical protein